MHLGSVNRDFVEVFSVRNSMGMICAVACQETGRWSLIRNLQRWLLMGWHRLGSAKGTGPSSACHNIYSTIPHPHSVHIGHMSESRYTGILLCGARHCNHRIESLIVTHINGSWSKNIMIWKISNFFKLIYNFHEFQWFSMTFLCKCHFSRPTSNLNSMSFPGLYEPWKQRKINARRSGRTAGVRETVYPALDLGRLFTK